MNKMHKLTEDEREVIENKATERPFSGRYNDHFEKGYYVCKRCNNPLFESSDKFRSNCGWPSFDRALKGAVIEEIDEDGNRTEIICGNCKAHLGHVFRGEKMTPKDTRHCVNSIALKFFKK